MPDRSRVTGLTTHYQRLGVAPSASLEEIRAGYRTLARRLHPDRQSTGTMAERALAERRMREINEAWQTLRDPLLRHRYDESLRATRPATQRVSVPTVPGTGGGVDGDDDLIDVMGDVGPIQAQLIRGLPWAVLILVFGLIFVFTAYATANRSSDPPTTASTPATVAAGSCLQIRSGSTPPATSVVPCRGPHDGRLVARVSEVSRCPTGTERRRLSRDGLLDCIAPT